MIEKKKKQQKQEHEQAEGKNNIFQVAKLSGVSIATVSRVMSGKVYVSSELTSRVKKAALTLGYCPNRSASNLRKRVSKTIGVIISDIENPFFTSVIRGIETILYDAGYSLLFCNSDEDPKREKTHLSILRAEDVAGIILTPTKNNNEFCKSLVESGIQLVAIDRSPGMDYMDGVTVKNKKGAFEATSHLAQLGYQRIGIICGPKQTSTSVERLEGFKEALLHHNLVLDQKLIIYSDFRQMGGYKAMQTLLDLEFPPIAVMVSNNLMTLGALQAIHERNLKIPDQIAIVGFDDMPWATSLQPSLTAVAQPAFDIGTTAAQLLLERLKDPTRSYRQVVLDTKLMVRTSSGSKMNLLIKPVNET
ncbi:LacI family DNA-binding transcriptional regulator [Flexilinea flocculi]|uniref:Transcriptional regulator, LacI family n=1 Tax=Flexilinea flocculi TaxID=1678840 RepID=A0A0S7BYI4_9CHLR|nr:substrate-binding domain-containing protein [Flexilinea flocculi]GAP41423.1 transcriptional regulator, LacI family [Flexilinea flocculi]